MATYPGGIKIQFPRPAPCTPEQTKDNKLRNDPHRHAVVDAPMQILTSAKRAQSCFKFVMEVVFEKVQI
jgi:hypothetical protein